MGNGLVPIEAAGAYGQLLGFRWLTFAFSFFVITMAFKAYVPKGTVSLPAVAPIPALAYGWGPDVWL